MNVDCLRGMNEDSSMSCDKKANKLLLPIRPQNNSRTLDNVRTKSKIVLPNEKHTGHSHHREKFEAKPDNASVRL